MKSIWIAFLSVMYMLGSILCINQSPDTTSNEEVSIQPTGYPDGELQWTYIFWEGNLYSNDAIFVKTLPEDAYQIGEIAKVPKNIIRAAYSRIRFRNPPRNLSGNNALHEQTMAR